MSSCLLSLFGFGSSHLVGLVVCCFFCRMVQDYQEKQRQVSSSWICNFHRWKAIWMQALDFNIAIIFVCDFISFSTSWPRAISSFAAMPRTCRGRSEQDTRASLGPKGGSRSRSLATRGVWLVDFFCINLNMSFLYVLMNSSCNDSRCSICFQAFFSCLCAVIQHWPWNCIGSGFLCDWSISFRGVRCRLCLYACRMRSIFRQLLLRISGIDCYRNVQKGKAEMQRGSLQLEEWRRMNVWFCWIRAFERAWIFLQDWCGFFNFGFEVFNRRLQIRVRFSKRSLHEDLTDAMGGSWVKIL